MKKFFATTAASAALLGSLAFLQGVSAEDQAGDSVTNADAAAPVATKEDGNNQNGASQADAMQVSREGRNATQAMHAARVALFNGDTQQCQELLSQAQEALGMAAQEASLDNSDLIPIDGSLELAETFVPSEQTADYLAKANAHFQQGQNQEGIEQLKLGNIGVTFSRVLLPLEATTKQLAEAVGLMQEQKYYEANLTLKAAGEGLEFDSITLVESPPAETPAEVPAEISQAPATS